MQKLSARQLAEQVIEDVRSQSPRHTFAIEGPDVELMGDPDMLARALVNLVENAVKYSPEGGRVIIRLRPEADALRIEVEDTGPGIESKYLAHLFEPFYRGPTTGKVSGTGLGLYVVKRIVEAHGGRVEVQSEPGHGSIFTLVLPLTQSKDSSAVSAVREGTPIIAAGSSDTMSPSSAT